MFCALKRALKKSPKVRSAYDSFRIWSLNAAIREQNLSEWLPDLRKLVPDISDQYTNAPVNTEYLELKVRGLHAFQVRLVIRQMEHGAFYIDVGDSSGTHALYLRNVWGEQISLNVDPKAIERIRAKGLVAHWRDIEAGWRRWLFHGQKVTAMFEVLEHLENPVSALRRIRQEMEPDCLVVTVPYVRRSRIKRRGAAGNPENTHLFELCPADWGEIFRRAGWEVAEERTYFQYPGWMPFLAPYWRLFDFEGFWGAVLKIERKGENDSDRHI